MDKGSNKALDADNCAAGRKRLAQPFFAQYFSRTLLNIVLVQVSFSEFVGWIFWPHMNHTEVTALEFVDQQDSTSFDFMTMRQLSSLGDHLDYDIKLAQPRIWDQV